MMIVLTHSRVLCERELPIRNQNLARRDGCFAARTHVRQSNLMTSNVRSSAVSHAISSKYRALEPALTEEDAMLIQGSKAMLTQWRGSSTSAEWQEVDRELRSVAKRRCALDSEEARLLSRAVRGEIWRHVGSVTLQEYLEEILGYSPRQARERVRVALALDDLPEMLEALAAGELSYSAVRELTRIATRATEREWCDHARGKKLKQIEQAVAAHRRGERPSDPPSPDLAPTTVEFEIRPATLALLREAQQMLAQERGEPLDDDAFVAALCSTVLEGGANADDSDRARYHVTTTVCSACSQGWRDGAGATLALDAADVARAQCDAQRIGLDQEPERATQDVAPMTVRFVIVATTTAAPCRVVARRVFSRSTTSCRARPAAITSRRT
jgi:hypothetical protein